MSDREACDAHAWASVGLVTRGGTIHRVWECEQCGAWTAEPFDPERERAWDDTWLSKR
jgi:hypothetical protein